MDGYPIVMLHGQPGSRTDWQLVAGHLPPEVHAIALDRPGYGANPAPAGGFDYNGRAVLAEMDARAIGSAVLVAHSYAGGAALAAALAAPERVRGLILLASVGPQCLTGWDRLLAAPVAGEICALAAWWLTPWLPRAGLALTSRLRRRSVPASEHVNWQIWAGAHHDHGPVWRSFLTEQRALTRELAGLAASLAGVRQPVLLIADPMDTMTPVRTSRLLAAELPHARVELLTGVGHHLPRRAAPQVAAAIVEFLAALGNQPAAV